MFPATVLQRSSDARLSRCLGTPTNITTQLFIQCVMYCSLYYYFYYYYRIAYNADVVKR